MRILSFGHADETGLPEKPRPAIRFGSEVGTTELTEQQQRLEETAKRTDASITAKQKELEAKFGKPLSGAELYDLMSEALRKTSIMNQSAKDLSGNHDDIKTALADAEQKTKSLYTMARLLRDDPSKVPNIKAPVQPGSFWSNEFKVAAVVPYIYTKMLLHREVKVYGTLTNVANIPSGVISYVANQAGEGVKAIGSAVPTWIYIVGGLIGAAYLTNTIVQTKMLMGARAT